MAGCTEGVSWQEAKLRDCALRQSGVSRTGYGHSVQIWKGIVITMAIRWVNNYHRGFSRLWLVLAVMGAFVFVTFNMLMGELLMGEYKVSKLPSVRYPLYRPDVAYRPDEDMIKQHAP